MPSNVLKCQLERRFRAGKTSLGDEVVDVTQQVAALSAVECADIVTQLLTYFDAYVRQLKAKVSYIWLKLFDFCIYYLVQLT